MAAEPVFVDTNVLVYVSRRSAPEHAAARAAVDRLQDGGHPLWISPQVLREYLATVVRPEVLGGSRGQAPRPRQGQGSTGAQARRGAAHDVDDGRGLPAESRSLAVPHRIGRTPDAAGEVPSGTGLGRVR